MRNFGQLVGMLISIAMLGLGCPFILKKMESEMRNAAVEAHKSGYIGINEFHHRLVSGI